MRRLVSVIALLLAAVPAAVAGPANAGRTTVSDPVGDGLKGQRLDITSVRVNNRDHAIVTTVAVRRVAAGDFAVVYQARGKKPRKLAAVYSERFPGHHHDSFRTSEGKQPCERLKVTWDRDADFLRVRLPSTCFNAGDFGGVRVKVITEIGSDADVAPKDSQGRWRWTAWTSRG